MRLISWNVNGLRAVMNKGFNDFFESIDADIFCIQETKLQEGQIDYKPDGYFVYWNSAVKKGYSGTAVFSKIEPKKVIYGINIEEHGMEMFNAGSNLSSKTAKEIIMQDYKKFSVNDIKIGVGQINTMSQAEIDNIRGKIIADGGVDMVYLLMTNIMTESSEVVFAGKSAGSVLANAFNVQVNGKSAVLEKIVSRKKQFFPAIMETLQQ